MIFDSRDVSRGSTIEADLCIIGGGAAGISIALQFAGGSHEIVLLEGGGLQYDQASQSLYGGTEQGPLIAEGSHYLEATRLRYFGGTTNHWHGWCRPFDPEDFEARHWVENSGWPLSFSDVEPYYAQACELLEISPFDYDQLTAGSYERLLDGDETFDTNFFHLSPPTRFAQVYREPLETSPNIRVITNANVRSIDVDADSRHVVGLDAARADGSPLPVRARHYVLATGGIENARMLLNSDGVLSGGLGNEHDLVGRYFMEHPLQRIGAVVLPHRRTRVSKTYSKSYVKIRRNWVRGVLRARPEVQERHGLLNAVMVVDPMRRSEIRESVVAVDRLVQSVAQLAQDPRISTKETGFFGWIKVHTEQSPNPASRVSLSDEKDRLGVRRVDINWQVTEPEVRTIRGTVELLAQRLGARFDGRCRLLPEEPTWARATWSNHHMGTTRMSDSPQTGVVDPNCRVHGVENLFVAGSSVFCTSGCSNPTLTLVALGLRLSQHLTGLLKA